MVCPHLRQKSQGYRRMRGVRPQRPKQICWDAPLDNNTQEGRKLLSANLRKVSTSPLQRKYQGVQSAARRNSEEFQQRKALDEDWAAGQGSSENYLWRWGWWERVSASGDQETWAGARAGRFKMRLPRRTRTLCQALCWKLHTYCLLRSLPAPCELGTLIMPFYRWQHWSIRGLAQGHLARKGRARIWTQGILAAELCH